jgi:ABC-type multidrug transport system permease subunit
MFNSNHLKFIKFISYTYLFYSQTFIKKALISKKKKRFKNYFNKFFFIQILKFLKFHILSKSILFFLIKFILNLLLETKNNL